MDVLNYHLEADSRYSLVYITDDKQDVVQWTTEYENRIGIREATVETNRLYLIYKRSETEPLLKGFTEGEILGWLNENFSAGEQQALVAIVRAFHGILDEVEEGGGTFGLYRQSDFEKVPAILESHLEASGSVGCW